MGLGPIGPTGPPGSVKPNRLGSGSVNRPSPAPSLSSLSPRALWWYLDRRRRRPVTPANSGGSRRRCLDRMVASTSSTNSSSWKLQKLPLWGDLGGFPLEICRHRTPLIRCLAKLELADPPPVLVLRECSPVEVPRCGAPGACLVKSSPGSLWLAAQALPCHAIQTSTWATVSVVPPLNLLLLFLWPWFLTSWSRSVSQAHRPCSVMLLPDASLVQCVLFSDTKLDLWLSCFDQTSVSVCVWQKGCSETCHVANF
jgi:hypothetical protein